MIDDPVFILAVLAACVVVSEMLVRHTALRHGGTALVVIVVTAIAANSGLIPTGTREVPLYSVLFREGAWMSIFWLLLQVDLRRVLRAGGAMIALFSIGAAGTMLGAVLGMWVIDGGRRIGEAAPVLAGMYTGTYTGGSANFIAIASQYGLSDGTLLAAANAVDAAMTTVWMGVTLVLPRLLPRSPGMPTRELPEITTAAHVDDDTETVHPLDLAVLLFLGAFSVWLSEATEAWIRDRLGVEFPAILILTTLALALAQMPIVGRLRGARLLGMFGVYLFLAVIGALCDLEALAASGALGISLLVFVLVLFLVHGTVTYGLGQLLGIDPDVASVASQANIGGGTSALALARSLGRSDLVLPGILVGSLGTALGTYLGVLVVTILGR